MTALAHASRRDTFSGRVVARLADAGFDAPRADQARVLVFDALALRDDVCDANALLDRTERARALRFHHPRDRDVYVLAHAVWRIVLGECLRLAPSDVPLARTADGQPRLPGTALSTSLSHSGDVVALAVSPAATIGVDIETYPPRVDLDTLMPVFCTRAEIAQLSVLDDVARRWAQMELWTRKEALLKAFGVGLLTDPATTPAPATHLLLPPPEAAHYPPCITRNLEGCDRWVAAFAAPPAIRDIRLHTL